MKNGKKKIRDKRQERVLPIHATYNNNEVNELYRNVKYIYIYIYYDMHICTCDTSCFPPPPAPWLSKLHMTCCTLYFTTKVPNTFVAMPFHHDGHTLHYWSSHYLTHTLMDQHQQVTLIHTHCHPTNMEVVKCNLVHQIFYLVHVQYHHKLDVPHIIIHHLLHYILIHFYYNDTCVCLEKREKESMKKEYM